MEAPRDLFETGKRLMTMLQNKDSVEDVMSFLEEHEEQYHMDVLFTMLAEDAACMLAVGTDKSYVADVVRAATARFPMKPEYQMAFLDVLKQSLEAMVTGARWDLPFPGLDYKMKCRVAKFLTREMGVDVQVSVTDTETLWLAHTESLFEALDKSDRRLVKRPIMQDNRDGLASALGSLVPTSTSLEKYAIWTCVKYGASDCLSYLMTCLENSSLYVGEVSERSFRTALLWFCYLCGDRQILSVLRQAGIELQQWVDGRQVCPALLGAAIQGHNSEIVKWMLETRGALPPPGMHYAIKAHNYEVLSDYWRDICVYAREEKQLKELIHIAMESNFLDFLENLLPLCSSEMGAYLVQEAIECDSYLIQRMILSEHQPLLSKRMTADGDTVLHMLARKNSPQLTFLVLEFVGSEQFCPLLYQDNGRSKNAWQVARETNSGFDLFVSDCFGFTPPVSA